jgi:hypothetical protein
MVEALGVLERRFEAAVGCENDRRMELTGEGSKPTAVTAVDQTPARGGTALTHARHREFQWC